jgi:mono/diheme cytochrome c family protein
MRKTLTIFFVLVAIFTAGSSRQSAQRGRPNLERQYTQTVRPFTAKYCVSCHGEKGLAAQFDLRPYTTMAAVVKDHAHWALVLSKLEAGEMPPPSAEAQPTAEERKAVIGWVDAMRKAEARRNAGDPGLVLARRLSNAEYNNTIRDLTGQDLKPAREFPVDPANQSGFDNSGESLAMSPSLLTKYLQAAREVANHMVFKPQGVAFAPHPMLVETDRDRWAVNQIIDFYKRQTTDYSDYFAAAWRYKHRAALGSPRATLTSIAAEENVSEKYLATIWRTLEETQETIGPLAKLQTMWSAIPPPSKPGAAAIARGEAEKMRDYVVQLRKKIEFTYTPIRVKGLGETAQPFLMYRNRQYANNRMSFNRAALRVEGEEPSAAELKKLQTNAPAGQFDAAGNQSRLAAERAAKAIEADLVVPAGQRAEYEAAFGRFAAVFPDFFYVSERGRYFPDLTRDTGRHLSAGFHNVMGYFRDDKPLYELVLDANEQRQLDEMWRELDFVALGLSRTFIQFFLNESGEARGARRESEGARPADKEITSEAVVQELAAAYRNRIAQVNNAEANKAIDEHFAWVNTELRWLDKAKVESEPTHLKWLLDFARRAYRRNLTQSERADLEAFYRTLREKDGLSHEDAMRDTLVMVLVSPDFAYRIDLVDANDRIRPLNDYALASRLSYFLWSSMPDDELLAVAGRGELRKPEVLVRQAKRMLKDPRVRGLATEFGGNFLDFRRFEEHNAVDRERFAAFDNELRQAMFEEPVRFLLDVVQQNRPVTDLLFATHTFVNPVLAKHYGMPAVAGGADTWVRVDDADKYGRGGLLPMAVFLTKNAPGLRTSPVKRGYWVVKTVLGEHIPPPPAVVPELPRDEAKLDLPLRELLAKHRENKACASCHSRFDALGLVFEGYGMVGERRTQDLSGRAIDASATFPGGTSGTGIEGLRAYVRDHRQNDFLTNVSRKMLSYALGRSLMLSDDILVESMRARLVKDAYRFDSLVESIVTSDQFRNKRGGDELSAKR